MYRCRCHTCDEDSLKENLGQAQEVFNAHAEQQHEVVLRRVELHLDEETVNHVDAPDTGSGEGDEQPSSDTPGDG